MAVDDVSVSPDPVFGAAVRALPYPVLIASADGVVSYANPAAVAFLGRGSLVGVDLAELRVEFIDDGAHLADCVTAGMDVDDRTAGMTVRSARRWVRCTLRRVSDADDASADPALLLSMVDVTTEHRAADELKWQTHHDYLTGLLNPAGFMLAAQKLLDRARGRRVAVILLSLNSFGIVTDTMGHDHGDSVLRAIGRRIAAVTPGAGSVGRVAGNQFAVIVPAGAGDIAAIVARLARAVAESSTDLDDAVQVTMRIGVATSGGPVDTAVALFANATIALARAPVGTAGQYVLFQEEFLLDLKRAQRMEYELRKSLRGNSAQLAIAYQPIVRMSDGAVVGVEALARWTHPELGPVSPNEFIPVAEESDLIEQVGARMRLDAAAEFAAAPRRSGMTLALNVSRIELADPTLVERVQQDISRSGLTPDEVCIEITERAFATDNETVGKTVAAFRDRGFQVSLDDFGTGVSSLSQLGALPITAVKIAQPFVTALGERDSAQAVLASIVDIAHANGLVVVAEGVETERHAQMVWGVMVVVDSRT